MVGGWTISDHQWRVTERRPQGTRVSEQAGCEQAFSSSCCRDWKLRHLCFIESGGSLYFISHT